MVAMALVADYSAGKPGAQALKLAGFTGAVRYVGFSDPSDSRTPKCTNAQELADFTANGLGMALVFESRADDWRGGYSAGWANYLVARRHADQIGFPGSRPIYMAVDSEVIGAANHAQMADYIRGARDAAGGPHLVGVYGQYSVCQYLAQAGGHCDWFWQCRAWSGTPIQYFAGRHLFQHVGTVYAGPIPCDVNDVNQSDWGQHTEDGMSAQEAYEGLAKLIGDMEHGGAQATGDELARILLEYPFLTQGDQSWEPYETTVGAEMKYNAYNFSRVFAALKALSDKINQPTPVVLSPEDRAAIVAALKAELPAAVVAEFKKEGN